MSGLFGYSHLRHTALPHDVATHMGAAMRHQPHHRVETSAPCGYLAVGRHSIGILNQAAQPVRSADGTLWLWLCGEFYHQQERRDALGRAGALAHDADDAALALAVYLRAGADGLTQLNGAFTLVVWDARRAELLIVNDRFGLYPHYYAHIGGALAFAPEIKGVLVAPEVPRRLSDVALAEYVRFQQLLGDKTWFEDVRLLPAATLLRYQPEGDCLTLRRYWHPSAIGEQRKISFDDAVDEANRLFQRAVDAMIAGPLRVGVYLSGGLDGRMILGYIGGKVPVATATFGQPGCRDVVYAAEIARRARSNHRWFPLTSGDWVTEYAPLHLALTEGQHSWMHAHGLSTYGAARTQMDVNLSGWEGEMTLGGLLIGDTYAQDQFYRRPPSEADFVQRMYDAFCKLMTWPGVSEAEASALFGGRGSARLRSLAFESLTDELARTRDYPAHRRADYFTLEQYVRRPLQQQIVFARTALEVRCPFFDYDLIEFVYALPLAVQCDPQFRRAMITRAMPRLATVPYEKDDRLPHSSALVRGSHAFVQRAKGKINRKIAPIFTERPRLYADYEHYLRTDLRGWAEAILFDPRTLERGLFDPAAVRALWARHCSGRELWTIGKIAPLMSIELVLRAFYDNPPDRSNLLTSQCNEQVWS